MARGTLSASPEPLAPRHAGGCRDQPCGLHPVAGSKIATHELKGSVWAAVLLGAAPTSSAQADAADPFFPLEDAAK